MVKNLPSDAGDAAPFSREGPRGLHFESRELRVLPGETLHVEPAPLRFSAGSGVRAGAKGPNPERVSAAAGDSISEIHYFLIRGQTTFHKEATETWSYFYHSPRSAWWDQLHMWGWERCSAPSCLGYTEEGTVGGAPRALSSPEGLRRECSCPQGPGSCSDPNHSSYFSQV